MAGTDSDGMERRDDGPAETGSPPSPTDPFRATMARILDLIEQDLAEEDAERLAAEDAHEEAARRSQSAAAETPEQRRNRMRSWLERGASEQAASSTGLGIDPVVPSGEAAAPLADGRLESVAQTQDGSQATEDEASAPMPEADDPNLDLLLVSTKTLKPSHSDKPRKPKRNLVEGVMFGFGGNRSLRYRVIFILSLMCLWLPALLFVGLIPSPWVTKWSMVIAGAGATSTVSLDRLGTASSASLSPFSGFSLSPTANYKTIITNPVIAAKAAGRLGMTAEEFGKPQVKVADQTSVIDFTISGRSPLEAKEKASAFVAEIQGALQKLREDEAYQRDRAMRDSIDVFERKLQEARNRLIEHQTKHGYISTEQFREMSIAIERVRQQRETVQADAANKRGRIDRLGRDIGLDSREASLALRLSDDPMFVKLRDEHASVAVRIARDSVLWDKGHPEMQSSARSVAALRRQMEKRAVEIAGSDGETVAAKIADAAGPNRADLFRALMREKADIEGLEQQIAEMSRTIEEYEKRLSTQGALLSEVDDLTHDQQVAEAVFRSALARADSGKTDPYGSYPILQNISPPEEPNAPDSSAKKFAVAGAVIGTIMLAIGMVMLWSRKRIIQTLLKNI